MGKCIRVVTRAALSVFCLLLASIPASPQINVLATRYDNARTGANLNETQLNPSNVNVNNFGKLWSYAVDGSLQAQPLYVSNVIVGGTPHNVLYVVTMNDKAYAFDADSNTMLWSVDFTSPPAIIPVPVVDIVGSNDLSIVGNVGIESTPAIDLSTNTIYMVVRTKENGSYFQRLHALDIGTGAEKFGGPTTIAGFVPGNGNGSSTVTFDPKIENQRSGLALANGQVFIAWASHEDLNAYHGWVMAYDATSLQQTGIFCVTPNGAMGGIWESGWAPAVDDSGNLYYISGNGDWDGVTNFGESFFKFSSANKTLTLVDWFTPDNWLNLNGDDSDVGASGSILIPGTNLLVGGGKRSIFYLLNTASLGHEEPQNVQIPQFFSSNGFAIRGGPVYWNRSGGLGPWLYVWTDFSLPMAFHFNGSTFDPSPVSQGTITAPCCESTGGVLTLSANGSNPGSGIIWSSMPWNQDAQHGTVDGVLRALNADDLTQELWNSRQNQTRDDLGLWPKYSPPVVANGRVYASTFSGQLGVYGLLATTPDFNLSAAPGSATISPGQNASYTITVSPQAGFEGSISLTFADCPLGATCSFTPSSITLGSAPASATFTILTSNATTAGTYSVMATASSGAMSHSASVSLTVQEAPPPQDFQISALALSPATVQGGGSASSTITIAPVSGFGGSVNLSCSITPALSPTPACSFNPSSVSGSGSSLLTVSTTAAKAYLAPHSGGVFYAMLFPVCGLSLLWAGFGSCRKRVRCFLLGCSVFSVLIFMAACGGGSAAVGTNTGTPASSYTITVTGTSGSLQHTVTVTLRVQ
jgi:PQQ-like domain